MPFSSVIEALNEARYLIEEAHKVEGINFHVARRMIDQAFADMGSPQGQALQVLLNERVAQDKQWGGAEHDDQHHPEDWIAFIQHQVEKFTDGPGPEVSCESADEWNFDTQRFIAIGALALAALESRIRQKLAADQTKACEVARTLSTGQEGAGALR